MEGRGLVQERAGEGIMLRGKEEIGKKERDETGSEGIMA